MLIEQANLAKIKAKMADSDLQKEALLEQSQKKYIMKKRLSQRKLLDDGIHIYIFIDIYVYIHIYNIYITDILS